MSKGICFSVVMFIFCFLGFNTSENSIEINSKYEQVRQGESKIRFIYFGATWCSPCKITKKNLNDEDVKKELVKFDVSYYDTDKDGNETRKYKVKSIPTIIFEKDGKTLSRYTGQKSKADLLKMLKNGK